MIISLIVIAIVVGGGAFLFRGQQSDAAAFRDGKQRRYDSGEGTYGGDGD